MSLRQSTESWIVMMGLWAPMMGHNRQKNDGASQAGTRPGASARLNLSHPILFALALFLISSSTGNLYMTGKPISFPHT